MGDRLRLWLGGTLAAFGLVLWAVATAVIEPAIVSAHAAILADLERTRFTLVGAEDQGQFLIWGKELRWSAIILAVGGLVLTVRRLAVGALAAAMAVGLFTADVVLDRSVDWSGWGYAAGLAVIALSVAALGVFALARGHHSASTDPLLLLSAVVMASVAPLQFWNTSSGLPPWLPTGMPALTLTLAGLLVLATVLSGLAAARHLTLWRVVGAVLLFLAGAGALTAYGLVRLGGGEPEITMVSFAVRKTFGIYLAMAPAALTALLVGGTVLVARGLPRRWYGRVGVTLALAAAVVAAPVATIPGLIASITVTPGTLAGLGGAPLRDVVFPLFAAVSLAVAMAIGAVGLVGMLPRSRPLDEPPVVVLPAAPVPASV